MLDGLCGDADSKSGDYGSKDFWSRGPFPEIHRAKSHTSLSRTGVKALKLALIEMPTSGVDNVDAYRARRNQIDSVLERVPRALDNELNGTIRQYS
jgi:hypothetical protein